MIGGLFKSASRVALVAAAGIIAGGVAAQAADLGGNCCADLEERVAELEATAARKGNRKVSLTVYGQVNKALLWHDDEDGYRSDKVTVRDNDAAMSRFGFRGEAKIRPDLTAGYHIEIGVREDLGTSSSSGSLLVRHNYLYLDSQTFGRVSLGQTSQVTDGLYHINLGNTQVTPQEMDEPGLVLSGPFTDTFAGVFDGSRRQGVYYRTPTLAGFILSAGWSNGTQSDSSWPYTPDDADDHWEVALRYAGEFNGVRIAAGVGYREEEDNTPAGFGYGDNQIWMASASIMHTPTGLFVSGGYADRDSDALENRRDSFWVQAGVEKNWFGPGATTLFGEYGEVDVDNNAWAGVHDGSYWGGGVVQKIDAAAMDLYLNVRKYELDSYWANEEKLVGSHDATVVVGGAIIRF